MNRWWRRLRTIATGPSSACLADDGDRANALCWVAEAQVKTGERSDALRSITEASEIAGGMRDARQSGWIFANIAEVQAMAGDDRAAVETARRIADEAGPDAVLVEICDVLCRERYFREAVATAREIASAHKRAGELGETAGVQVHDGDIPGSARAVALATEAAGEIVDACERAGVLASIAGIQLDAIEGGPRKGGSRNGRIDLRRPRAYIAPTPLAVSAAGRGASSEALALSAVIHAHLRPCGPVLDFFLA